MIASIQAAIFSRTSKSMKLDFSFLRCEKDPGENEWLLPVQFLFLQIIFQVSDWILNIRCAYINLFLCMFTTQINFNSFKMVLRNAISTLFIWILNISELWLQTNTLWSGWWVFQTIWLKKNQSKSPTIIKPKMRWMHIRFYLSFNTQAHT